MDALAGLFDPDAARDTVEPILARMRRALEFAATPVRAEMASAAGAGCILLDHRSAEGESAVARDLQRGLCLAFAGELYDRDALRAQPGGAPAADSAARLCLSLYCRDGADFVRRLNGQFNIVIYRESERRLSIATDPFGYRPLFLAQRGRRVLFASEMKAILAVLDSTPAVDGIALLQLARRGWPLGDRTWLESIRVAPPGTWLEITATGVSKRRYFRFHFQPDEGASSLSSYVDDFAEHVRRAVQRTAAGSERVGIPPARVRVIPNGIDASRFRPGDKAAARARLGLPPDRPLLLGVGAFLEHKGHERVLDALPRLAARRPDILYVAIGNRGGRDSRFGAIERRVREQQLGTRVRLELARPHEEMPLWMAAADLFCLATGREGWSNAITEALACGLPVVTTRVGGNAEIVRDGEDGFLIPFFDADAFVDAIERGLQRNWDRAAIAQRAAGWRWETVASAVFAELERACRSNA